MKKESLEDQLASKIKVAVSTEKQIQLLRDKIEAKEKASKPKSILDRVNTLSDVLKIAKPTKEELAVIKYTGKSKRMLFAKHMMVLSLISEVLNEGWLPKLGEYRWYPYFDVSSGFVFHNTFCGSTDADSGSASRLCLKSDELAAHAWKIFLPEWEKLIM